MQLRKGLSTPATEHAGRMKQSEEQLKNDSRLTQGKLVGAAAGAGLGAGYLLKRTKGGVLKGRGIGKGVRGKAALLAGAVGAGYGSLVGGAVGANLRKGKKKDLAARLEDLHEFVSLVRERGSDSFYNGEDCGPTMYVSGLADPEVMSMPKEGTAMVRYKVRSRSVNERGDAPTYGADIAISTLEPVKEAAGKKEMGVLERLREFAAPARSVTKLMKTSKRNPLSIRKTSEGEFRVAPKGSATAGPLGYYTNDIKDARNTAAGIWKKENAQMKARGAAALRKKVDRMETGSGNRPDLTENAMPAWAAKKEMGVLGRLREFADRERNPSGQFISGVSSNPDDMAMAYKKKVGKIAGAAVLGGGAAMAAMPAGRKLIGRGAQGMLRGAGRVLLR